MNGWMKLGFAGARKCGVAAARRAALWTVAGAIALFCVLAATLWIVWAFWLYLLPMIGPPLAALAAAGLLLAIALIALIAARLATPRPRRRVATAPQMPAIDAGKAIGELEKLVRHDKGAWLILAALAGVALSASQSRR
jgi:hypothetical protein